MAGNNEKDFGEEVRNCHPRSLTAHLLLGQDHIGTKFLYSNMKLSPYHMKTPRIDLSPELVIKELPLGVATLVANLLTQIFYNWNQSPHNLLNTLNSVQHDVPTVDYPKKEQYILRCWQQGHTLSTPICMCVSMGA